MDGSPPVVGRLLVAWPLRGAAGLQRRRILDHGKLERGVVDQSHSLTRHRLGRSCPEAPSAEWGDTFTCRRTLAGGEPVTLEVTQTEQRRDVTWRSGEAALTGEEFAGSRTT